MWLSADGRSHGLSREVGPSVVLLRCDDADEPLVKLAEMLSEH